MRKPTSVDPLEMARFSQQAKEWWNIKGPYSMLLRMNPVRVGYIRNYLIGPNGTTSLPFKGLKMLDIGCGGGFLSQSLARLGAQVTAVDANLENIKVAQSYRGETNIQFIHGTAEEFLEKKQDFDAVCGLEIVEHVVDPKKFIDTCSLLCKPGGSMFFSTINRTPVSYFGTILLAEHILKWVPKDTHTYQKYITPQELEAYVTESGAEVLNTTGMSYNPFTKIWSLDRECHWKPMNYILAAQKLVQ